MVNIAEVKAEVKIAVILGFIVFRIVLQCFTRKFMLARCNKPLFQHLFFLIYIFYSNPI